MELFASVNIICICYKKKGTITSRPQYCILDLTSACISIVNQKEREGGREGGERREREREGEGKGEREGERER
jgi:hypothetical protein